MMKQLTNTQKLFVAEYIKTLDGEKALKTAGYSLKNPKKTCIIDMLFIFRLV